MRISCSIQKALLAMIASVSLLSTTAGVAFAQPALPAHATVLKAEPAIGSTITAVPTKVTVFTAENIDPNPQKSNLQIYGPGPDATDTLISQGNAQVSLSNPREMSITITPNSGHINGVYIVNWKTVSADDGDPAAGSFIFTVNTGGGGTTPSQTQQNTSPANKTSGSSSAGMPIWAVFGSAFITLLLGLLVGFMLGRRQSAPSSFAAIRASIARDIDEKEQSKP